jgi:broad specificity phosphatase PhoE
MTSPTPYDPPLTQKGFAQAKQTGTYIKQSLTATGATITSPTTSKSPLAIASPPPRPSKRSIIIHTSPFLRCIQTALTVASVLEGKSLLRVDAWLGEWLTPDYYIDIAPPPPSRQLCSSALTGLAGRTDNPNVIVDWTWDSLQFGDGGEYGEAWGSMHDRFHRGLESMLEFYQRQDESDETVVILVTHGAGCNALLGAVTRKPVLTDIPISSLSMAVLKPMSPASSSSAEYELVLQAGTEHLSSNASSNNTFNNSGTGVFTSQKALRESTNTGQRKQNVKDTQILEYHHFRSSSQSSRRPELTTTYVEPSTQSTYQQTTSIGRPTTPQSAQTSQTPRLKLAVRPTSGYIASAVRRRETTPRSGLWTPTSSNSAVSSEDEEEVGTEFGIGRKSNSGLWRSWAPEENVGNKATSSSSGRERRFSET